MRIEIGRVVRTSDAFPGIFPGIVPIYKHQNRTNNPKKCEYGGRWDFHWC